jgi:hypothetical protein
LRRAENPAPEKTKIPANSGKEAGGKRKTAGEGEAVGSAQGPVAWSGNRQDVWKPEGISLRAIGPGAAIKPFEPRHPHLIGYISFTPS